MKEIGKLLLSGLIAAGLLFTAACAPEKENPPHPSPGGEKTTIVDAYDKGARPDYDGKFDYKSGYTPSEPETEAVVTIAESSSVKFKDGSKKMTLTVGKLLTQEDFDATSLDGKKIGGVAIMSKTEDEEPKEYISAFAPLSDFVPTAAVTVSPYFALEKGESILWGSNGKDKLVKIAADSLTEEKALFNGYMGLKVSYGAEIKSGASILYKAKMNVKRDERYTFRYTFVNYGTEELKFNLYQMKGGSNYDDPETAIASEEITLKAGETSKTIELTLTSTKNDTNSLTGLRFNSDMTSASFGVIMSVEDTTERLPAKITLDLPTGFTVKDYKTDVLTNTQLTLPVASQIDNKTGRKFIRWVDGNGNPLANGFTVKGDLTITPELSAPAKITVSLPDGLTVSKDYVTDIQTGDVIVAPTSAQISGEIKEGREIAGWYIVGGKNTIITGKTIAEAEKITIAPYFTRAAGTATLQNFGNANDGQPLVFSNVQNSLKPLTVYDGVELDKFDAISSKYKNDTVIGGGTNGFAELGNVLSYNGTMSVGSAFRCGTIISNPDKNIPVVTMGLEHTFVYNFQNFGTSKISLTIQGVNTGKEVEGPISNIILEPGESKKYTAQYLLGKNGNALTYIVFEKDADNFSFGIAVSEKIISDKTEVADEYKNQAALDNMAALTFEAGETGITVNAGYLNKFRAGKFITAPSSSDFEANGATIEKWQITFDGKAYDLPTTVADYTSLRMPSAGAVLTAVVVRDVTVTYEKPDSVTAEGGKTSYKTGEKLSLPTLSGADASGRTAIGWYDKATRKIVTNETVINDDLTLTPYYAPAKGEALTPLSGATINDKYGPDSLSAGLTQTFVKQTDVIVGGEKGITLAYTALKTGDAFRFKTKYSLLANKTYKFNYVFENFGSEDLTFILYQLKGGTNTDGMPNKLVTIKAGETQTVELTLNTGKNGNILTYFVIGKDVSALNMGIAMSISEETA